jgi:periplasmic copper chaperone A
MNRPALAAVFASAILLAVSAVSASADDISVRQAWSRATPKGAQVAAGYLTIENHGLVADKLLSASTASAGKIEIHEMTVLDGIMMMRPVDSGLVIPAGETITLTPGGNHLMFIGLNAPFREGQHIPTSLLFERAGKIEVSFEVGSVGAKEPRLIVASAERAATAFAAADPNESFFTHICGIRVMANVTVSPGRPGPVEVVVELEDANEQPLFAQTLTVTLSNPDAKIAPITATAERISDDRWRAQISAAVPGKWSLALGIGLAPNDQVDMAAPILIE